MKITELIKDFKEKKIQNTKLNEHAVSEYIKKELEVKTYLPFRTKRAIVEAVVAQNIQVVDGIKKIDSINEYVGFIVAVLSAHTNLEWSEDPVEDYDLLAESGLLPLIIAEFEESYSASETLMKMARAMELEDNNINVLVGRFLNGILTRVDGIGEVLKNNIGNINLQELLGENFKQEDVAKLKGFLDKYIK